jgi:hypothetical protein
LSNDVKTIADNLTVWSAADPICEDWLKAVGFKWHQLERQPDKHWLLWLGSAIGDGRMFCDTEDLGVEVAPCREGSWFCWLRSDAGGRYHRFIHVRHIRTIGDLIGLIEALTGQSWDPGNNWYGAMVTPERAAWHRREQERMDRRMMRDGAPWTEGEKDPTIGRPLIEHREFHEAAKRGQVPPD